MGTVPQAVIAQRWLEGEIMRTRMVQCPQSGHVGEGKQYGTRLQEQLIHEGCVVHEHQLMDEGVHSDTQGSQCTLIDG